MSEIVKLLPRFWSTALFADHRILKYMNEEEKEIMLKYLKSVHVTYHGDAKTGFEITFSFYENPHFIYLVQSKTFWFTREGISSASGSQIGWTTDKIRKYTMLHTDTASFFKWFAEDSQSSRDLLAEEIVLEFWPKAHKYHLIGKNRDTEVQRRVLTEHQSARKNIKRKRGGEKSDEGAMSKLTTISAKLQKAEEEATKLRCTRVIEYELMLVEGERKVHKECESLRRQIYDQRNEIIKNIPHFWLIAFLSHYALHYLLSEEDQKIFRFINSVNVEETEDNEGVISGISIIILTLKIVVSKRQYRTLL
ncbi:NAP1-related protein 2-like isoform X2 [Papaver somniferum]|uniref:NAP1-related protein 2-like isoform X2 n=1 Tax=Papaver somniferum TaxID=3469 RepID=UPI000E6F9C7A|nr:NAP1-related protein 2-like isoform X2 [Papaver somniferum]